MIDQLNNDCQLRIISYLDVRSQFLLWKATKNFSVRLNDNICWAWRNKKYSLTWIFSELKDDTEMLQELLSTNGETFQSSEPLRLTLKQLTLLINFKFPNVHELELELNDQYSECDLVPEIFPELHSLKLSNGTITGIRFEKFENLRKLELWECFGFGNYLTRHETLEELILDLGVNENIFYADTLKDFPKLRSIAFSLDDSGGHYYFHDTLAGRINDITELSFNEYICCYIESGLQLPQNCRRLSVINDYSLTTEALQALISGTLLEQLDLIDTKVFSSEIQLWKTVTVCPSLKILNISGMKLKNDSFELSRHHMEQALGIRSEPLTLHCHNTGVNKQLIEKNFKHPNLKVFLLPLPVKMIDQSYVEIKFHPLIAD